MTHIIVQNIFFCICIGCRKMGAFMWVPGFCHAENFVYAAEIPYK